LRGNWQDYYWQDASRGNSATAELLVKVVVTVTTTFSKWNLQFFKQLKVSQYCNFTRNAATVSSRHGKQFQQLTVRQL